MVGLTELLKSTMGGTEDGKQKLMQLTARSPTASQSKRFSRQARQRQRLARSPSMTSLLTWCFAVKDVVVDLLYFIQ